MAEIPAFYDALVYRVGAANFIPLRPQIVERRAPVHFGVPMIPALLIIDDHVSVRETLQFLLLRRGYTVHLAAGGAEALALAQQHPIDGALVDVQMPGMNGFEVCRALREHALAHGRPISIWMMSGGRSAELTKRAADAGALAMLAKPFEFADLYRRFDEQFGPLQAVAERAAS